MWGGRGFLDIPTPLTQVSMITTLGIWQSGLKLDISGSGTKCPPRWEPSGRCADVQYLHYSLELVPHAPQHTPAGTNAGALGQNWVTSLDGTLQSYGREALSRSTTWAHLTDTMWSKADSAELQGRRVECMGMDGEVRMGGIPKGLRGADDMIS